MSRSVATGLGETFTIERHLPPLGWRPRLRGNDAADFGFPDVGGGDDLGIFAIVGIVLLAIVLIVVLVPVLLFVAEVALVVALVVPLMVLALALGLKQHTVVLKDAAGRIIDQRSVHGVVGSVRARRQLEAAARAGLYR